MSTPQSQPSDKVFTVDELVENMDPSDGWMSYVSESKDVSGQDVGLVMSVDGEVDGACLPLFSSENSQEVLQAQIVCDGIADALNAGAPLELIAGVLDKLSQTYVFPVQLNGYKLVESYLAVGHRTTVFLRAETDEVMIREGYYNIDSGSAKEWLAEEQDEVVREELDL